VTSPVITTVTPVADVGLGKTGPANVLATSNLVYTISVTNFGPSSAEQRGGDGHAALGRDVCERDGRRSQHQRRGELDIGHLDQRPGEQRDGDGDGAGLGTLTNVASASSPTVDPNSTNNVTVPVITTVTPVADVGLGKTGAAIRAGHEQSGLHDISDELRTVERQQRGGDGHAALGVTFVSATGGGANTSGVVSWSIGHLDQRPGQQRDGDGDGAGLWHADEHSQRKFADG
jgi:hypothetical protein